METRIRELSSSANLTNFDGLKKSPENASPELPFSPIALRKDSTLTESHSESGSVQSAQRLSLSGRIEDSVETLGNDFHGKISNVGGESPIYRGQTTGLEVFRGLRSLCDSLAGSTFDAEDGATKMIDSLNLIPPDHQLSISSWPNLHFLSEASVHKWVRLAFDEAFVLWPFIDRHAFEAYAQHIIERGNFSDDNNNSDYLGLFHAVIALGQRHDPDLIGHRDSVPNHPETRG